MIHSTAIVSNKAKLGNNVKIGPFAIIDDEVVLGDNVEIGPKVHIITGSIIGNNNYIGEGTLIGDAPQDLKYKGGKSFVKIGSNTKINPLVSIYDGTEIGEGVLIHSGTVIGSDGFGFTEENGKIIKIPQIGFVKIGNGVEIGANCTIDRGSFGPTVISDNVKLDNLIHVAHNVEIGEGTLIAAQTGIAGSTKIGKHCIIGGQVGFVDHITIGNFVKIGSQAGVSKDVPDGAAITGTPARPIKELRRSEAYMMRLEELFKQVNELMKKK